jgi:hypothetical protein
MTDETTKLIADLNGEVMYGVEGRPNYVRELLNKAAAALEASERERERMRAEIVKAWKHTTPAGGSFRQWYDEIQAILSAALAPQPENPK